MFTHNSHFTIEGNAKKTNIYLPDFTMMNKNEGQNCKLTVSNKNHRLKSLSTPKTWTTILAYLF